MSAAMSCRVAMMIAVMMQYSCIAMMMRRCITGMLSVMMHGCIVMMVAVMMRCCIPMMDAGLLSSQIS